MSDDLDLSGFDRGDAPITAFIGDEPVFISPTTTLREAAHRLEDAGVGLLVVGTAESVEGVFSERDILRAVAADVDVDSVTVSAYETKDHLRWATPESSIGEVAEEMMEDYLRHILVRDDDRLVGIVSIRDVLAAYAG